MSETESAQQPLDDGDDERGPILDDSEDEAVAFMNSEDEAGLEDEGASDDEHKGPLFETQRLGGELADAYDCLQIRTPLEEFETFSRARLETLVKLGEAERAQLCSAALETGANALRHVMGASQEASQ